MAKTLVLAQQRARFRRVAPHDIRVGWRITCQNGEPYDVFWGSAKPEVLANLLADVRAKHGEVTVLDVRDRPHEVRDRDYYDAHAIAPEEGV